MTAYIAHLTGPDGAARRIDILAEDTDHARELAREIGSGLFGRREFTYSVRKAS